MEAFFDDSSNTELIEDLLRVYGFVDLSWTQPDSYLKQVPTISPYGGFVMGNVNLYVASNLGKSFKALTEVRLLFLPNGNATGFDENLVEQRTSTVAGDYNEGMRELKWGGIELERVWLQYDFRDWLGVRAGLWLTPYGIWNVDHGSPTIIAVNRPWTVGAALFPERQTGLQVFGKVQFGDASIGYTVTASNGRGPIAEYNDLDTHRALGARLQLDGRWLGRLTVGASWYRGRYTDRLSKGTIVGDAFVQDDTIREQYEEQSWAADLQWRWGGLVIQSELILHERAYTELGRPEYNMFGSAGSGLFPDDNRWGAYGLIGYRLPWLGIMPFYVAEYFAWITGDDDYPGIRVSTHTFGINARVTSRVVLKGIAALLIFDGSPVPGGPAIEDTWLFQAQASWAF